MAQASVLFINRCVLIIRVTWWISLGTKWQKVRLHLQDSYRCSVRFRRFRTIPYYFRYPSLRISLKKKRFPWLWYTITQIIVSAVFINGLDIFLYPHSLQLFNVHFEFSTPVIARRKCARSVAVVGAKTGIDMPSLNSINCFIPKTFRKKMYESIYSSMNYEQMGPSSPVWHTVQEMDIKSSWMWG